MAKYKVAYTVIEVIIVMLFVGILAAIAVPRINLSAITNQRADTTAKDIITDIRRTRSLAISDAADNPDGYELQMTTVVSAAPRSGFPFIAAISGSAYQTYRGYKIVNLHTDETVETHTINSTISCRGGSRFAFGPAGNLLEGSDTQLIIGAENDVFTITVTIATGAVKWSEERVIEDIRTPNSGVRYPSVKP